MKKAITLLLISLSSFGLSLSSISDTTDNSLKIFGNQINVGASLGIGEGHMNFLIPSLAVKLGRFNLKGLFYDSDQRIREDVQLQLDLFPINANHPTQSTFLTLSGGISNKYIKTSPTKLITSREMYFFGFGVNKYFTDTRSKISYNISASNYSVFTKTSNIKPQIFMGLSFNYFLFKFRDFGGYGNFKLAPQNTKPPPKQEPPAKVKSVKKAKVPFLGQWFNPMLSLGMGSDRAGSVGPGVGVRIGPVNCNFSMLGFDNIGFSGTFDLYKLNNGISYDRIIGLGVNALEGYSYDLLGGTLNYSSYKINGKHSIAIKLGIAQHSRSFPDLDLPPPSVNTWSLNGGFSINFYMFRYAGNRKPHKRALFNFL